MPDISRVPPELSLDVLVQVESEARKGLQIASGGSLTYEELRAYCLKGSMELWAVHEGQDVIAVLVLQAVRRADGLVLLVVLMAGRDFASWCERANGLLQEYAELMGAVRIESTSRKGAAKWLEQLGWKPRTIIMEKSIGQRS